MAAGKNSAGRRYRIVDKIEMDLAVLLDRLRTEPSAHQERLLRQPAILLLLDQLDNVLATHGNDLTPAQLNDFHETIVDILGVDKAVNAVPDSRSARDRCRTLLQSK